MVDTNDLLPHIANNVTSAAPAPAPAPATPQPPTQAPVSNTPAPVTPAPVVTATEPAPAFDQNKWLTENFGETFKSVDDIKVLPTKLKEYETTIAKLQKQVETAPVIADDPYIKGVNEAALKGISRKAFDLSQSIGDASVLDHKAALIKQHMIKDELTEAQAERLVNSEYKLGDAYTYRQDEDEVQVAQTKLIVAGNAAKAYLKKMSEDCMVPDQAKNVQKSQLEWQAPMSSLAEKSRVQKFDLPELGSFDYEVPADGIAEAAKYASDIVAGGNFAVNDDNIEFAQEIMNMYISHKHRDAIVKSAVQKLADKLKVQHIVETNHPSALVSPVVAATVEVDPGDLAIQRAKSRYGYTG